MLRLARYVAPELIATPRVAPPTHLVPFVGAPEEAVS